MLAGAAVVLVAACGDGGRAKAETPTTTTSFTGSPDSYYCKVSDELRNPETGDDAASIRETFERFRRRSAVLIEAAPPELRADVEKFVSGMLEVRKLYAENNYDTAAVTEATSKLLSDPAFREAADRLVAYDRQVCGIE